MSARQGGGTTCSVSSSPDDLAAERGENALGLARRQVHAAQSRDARRAQREGAAPLGRCAGDHDFRRLAAAERQDQAGREFGAPFDRGRVDAALEPVARVGFDAELAPRRRRADRVEQRHLEEHGGRVVAAARALAAHQPGDALHPVGVGDHGDRVVERVGAPVERAERLARAREPHGEVAGDGAGVEHVQRAREVERHVVGDVDKRRDRPQPDGAQPVLQPLRAGAVLQVAEIASARPPGRRRPCPRESRAATSPGSRTCPSPARYRAA